MIKVVLLQVKHMIKNQNSGLKKFLCDNTLERNVMKVYISLKGSKLTCFANS